eukprot:CAMPEP_0185588390 /NCGR_PEP_ID=MMETSP0434-20130131/52848_1 /TAXON_ID=626734 ORGANISM="Favella taraikaensis, Strain Fe Narragansett Bay" /NCGR_SAMPLE_ID=MMETSP0434 /ASSEMBLY_ACC=CAM_ASM_000379 /LENGTH=89 /DNA_ID=CAMNT_0028211009 /DNA_START=130 /DNA_END=399 /DNA_ORIENTATION=-
MSSSRFLFYGRAASLLIVCPYGSSAASSKESPVYGFFALFLTSAGFLIKTTGSSARLSKGLLNYFLSFRDFTRGSLRDYWAGSSTIGTA